MKRRTNVTLNPAVYDLATAIMKVRHFDEFSGFVEQLIREEWDRRASEVEAATTTGIAARAIERETKRGGQTPRKPKP